MPQRTTTIPGLSKRVVPAAAIKDLSPLLGDVAISWSFLDQIVEMWVVELGYEAVKRGIAKRISQSLEDRLELLRRCFRMMPELRRFSDDALEHLAVIEELATHRHMLTHGTLSHYMAEPEEAIVFMKLRYSPKQGFHVAEQEGYTFATLREMADEARKVTFAMQALKREFNDLFDAD